MNIFFLDRDPKVAAEYHCDKHTVKMILEYAQLMSTAVHLTVGKDDDLYKMTHKNHPSAIWTRSSKQHYDYVLQLFENLLAEYTRRYGKQHSTSRLLPKLQAYAVSIPDNGWVDPPQCMPEECKTDEVVKAYRNYYVMHKSRFATWKTIKPAWFEMA